MKYFLNDINDKLVFFFYGLLIFIFYFLFPWVKEGSVLFYRWDEAVYLYIYKYIISFGYIPNSLNYIGGIPNYIYPNLYLVLTSFLIFLSDSFSLKLASIALQFILFLNLFVSALVIRQLCFLATKNIRMSFLAGFFYFTLPIISYRLFYLNATFYANFIGITFLLLFLYYLTEYKQSQKPKYLFLSVFFYASTLFTHQLVFMMASILLILDSIVNILLAKRLIQELRTKTIFIFAASLLNIGYLTKIPITQKFLSIWGISKYQQFGEELVIKNSASALPPLVPDLLIIISCISALYIFINKKYRNLWTINFFFVFTTGSFVLNFFNIHLPASFRYDTFLIISLPFLLSFFMTNILKHIYIKTVFTIFLIFSFIINCTSITNGYSKSELDSVQKGLNSLDCKNTVSYFRIAPWIPTLSNSNIFYAHVDIYNAHQTEMNEEFAMFSNNNFEERISLIKSRHIDCLLYEKNFLSQDGIKIKGWEYWRYADLFRVSINTYEDDNIIVFKLNS